MRTARAPATQTKRARLPAFSTGQDGAEKLADWRLEQSQSGLCAGSTPRSGRRLPIPSADARPRSVSPAQKPEQRDPRDPLRPRPRQWCFASFGVCDEGCFGLPATRAVIYSAAPLPYPADAGAPRQTGPRRLIASLPAAGATQAGLRRPGALKITASCGREPVAPVTLTANGPAAQTLAPRRTRSARASRSCILHATPLAPLLCSVWRGRSPPTPVARPLHPRGLRRRSTLTSAPHTRTIPHA